MKVEKDHSIKIMMILMQFFKMSLVLPVGIIIVSSIPTLGTKMSD